MKRIIAICSTIILLSGFKSSDGDKFPEVKIGNQIWMKENLDVTTFRNGDEIKQAKTAKEWKIAFVNKQPAWCYLFFDSNIFEKRNNLVKYCNKYIYKYKKIGKIYNSFALIDPRNIAPIGWRVANAKDWKDLNVYLKDTFNLQNKKATYFNELVISRFNEGSKSDLETNTTGFSGIPIGYCSHKGSFFDPIEPTYFPNYCLMYGAINDGFLNYEYKNEKITTVHVLIWDGGNLESNQFQINIGNWDGLPVRCIKDTISSN